MLQVCGNCEAMTTSHENICCSEVDRVVEKKEEGSSAVSCIIDHEGFHSVCLDVWVLQTTYFNYTGSIMVWLKRRLYSCQLLLVLVLIISVESVSTKI